MPLELRLDIKPMSQIETAVDRAIHRPLTMRDMLNRLSRYGLPIALAAVTATFSVLQPDSFFTLSNAQAILSLSVPVTVAALGLTIALVMNEIDLSLGSMIGLCGAVAICAMSYWSIPWPLAILLALGVAMVAGSLTGWMVASCGANSLIISLGMATLLTGLEFTLTDQKTIYTGIQDGYVALGQSQIFGVNIQVLIAGNIALIAYLLLERSETGRYMYAVGANPNAAFLAGVPVRRLRIVGFTLSALGAAVAGVLLTAQTASAFSNAGQSYLLPAFASAFLGATLSSDGRFTVVGTLIAVMFIAVVQTGLTMLQLSTGSINIVQGGLLISAVLLSRFGLMKSRR